MKILSLYDGMACGMLAMLGCDVNVERYVAYEIDKYAIQTSKHNFPDMEQRGDVFDADFTEFEGFDFLIGGSPCTYWSIAQKNNRETEASGLGWELFCQYTRALHEAKPKYFIYENNKSMSNAIRDSIRKAFGFEEICINSALVSAQNRQRYYWVGKRNADGTYSKVDIKQPDDRGILLKDILETGTADRDKAHVLKHQAGNTRDYFKKHHTQVACEPVGTTADGKSFCVTANYWKGSTPEHTLSKSTRSQVAEPVNTNNGKSWVLKSQYYKSSPANFLNDNSKGCAHTATGVAEPVRVGTLPKKDGTTCQSKEYRIYDTDGKSTTLCAGCGGMGTMTGLYAVPVEEPLILEGVENSKNANVSVKKTYLQFDISGKGYNSQDQRAFYENCKHGALPASSTQSKTGIIHRISDDLAIYAETTELNQNGIPKKAVSVADGKEYPVYIVENGEITIKGKQYPIKLIDGYYIIRKLTVRECMRLQTVPEWYEFPVSNTQAYKMLGNGWTVEVIMHLLRAILSDWALSLLGDCE